MASVQERLRRAVALRYEVQGLLGSGASATVYRALDLKHQRLVAIKVLDPVLASSIAAERFLREIKTAARLTHPHILPLYDSDEADGLLYYVMPFVEGKSLHARIVRERRLPVEETVRIAGEVADALDYAHSCGVIHRDVKPENILDEHGHAVLADFGLAQALERAGGRRLTESGYVVGTPPYMSPEQIQGDVELDGRSDLYSLGCCVYEMLTGQHPFTGAHPLAIIHQHLSEEPRPVGALRPEVSSEVAQAVARSLAKSREDRFASGAEFERALRLSPVAGSRSSITLASSTRVDLPRQLSPFIGRENELWECGRHLRASRLLTLTGPGGGGKTRLAIQLAERNAPHFMQRVHFVDLAAIVDGSRVVTTTAAVLGTREVPSQPLVEALAQTIGEQPLLLVLDNCEHVIAESSAMAVALLEACPGLTVLATSRQSLGIPGEHVYLVPPLSFPDGHAAEDATTLGRFEAVRLFVDRAAAVEADFKLTDANAADVAAICRRLDGIPLAIELAAARVRLLGVGDIRARLEHSLRLLTQGSRAPLPRQQTLRGALQWSYDLLAPEEKRAFRTLAVFAGGWDLEAATSVLGAADEYAALEMLSNLLDKSLVATSRTAQDASRYRLIEILREYARDRLEQSGEATAARERHVQFFVALAEKASPLLWGPEQAAWLTRLEVEHENLLAALTSSSQMRGGAELGLRLAGSLYRFWYTHGHYTVGRRALEGVLALSEARNSVLEVANAHYAAGGLAHYQCDYQAAREHFEAALDLHRAAGREKGVARALIGLGLLAVSEEDFTAACAAYEESYAIYEREGDKASMALVLHNLGEAALLQDRPAEARPQFVKGLALSREMGNQGIMATSLCGLALGSLRSGEPGAARGELIECLRIVLELGALNFGVDGLEAAAEMAHSLGSLERATRLYGAAQTLREKAALPVPGFMRRTHETALGGLETSLGSEAFEEAWRIGRALGFKESVRDALAWLESLEIPAATSS